MMNGRTFVGRSAAVLVLWGISLAPAAAQGVGAIGGTIVDASGAVLPGVTVTLASPGMIGGNQNAVTDERGAYQFTRLVPAQYTVRAELSGFRSAAREGLRVNADVTVRVDLSLEVGQLEESVTVSGAAPLLDTSTALNQTVMSREVLDSLPNRKDLWSIARVIPFVVLGKLDVGGSEAFLQSTTTVHGSSNENGYMVDGMDVSSLTGNGTVAMIYLDPYAFEETNYQTSNGPAERSKGGVIFNEVTKSGTNAFHGGYMLSGANHGMGSANYSSELKAQLLAGVPATARAANPNIVPGADIQNIWDTGGWLGGPIVRNKLWFSASAHDQALNQYLLGSYNPDGTQVLDDNKMWTIASKVSWQVTRNSQLSHFYTVQYKNIGHRNGGGVFADSRARNLSVKYPQVNQVKWTAPISARLLVDISGSLMRVSDDFRPEPGIKDGDISHFDAVTNTYTVALPNYHDNPEMRAGLMGSLNYVVGKHDIKTGYQYQREQSGFPYYSTSGMRAVFRNGVPDSVNTYNTPVDYTLYTASHALYIQDKWRPLRNLTLNLGLRFETSYGWQPETCQVETVFVAGQCFPAIEGAPDWKAFAPRLSAVYDLFGDGRTALKMAANRYEVPPGVSFVAMVNPLAITSDTRSWTDANADLVPQLNELGPSTGFNFGTTNRYDSSLEWPVANEYSVEVERQLPWNMVVSAGYTRRETRRNVGPQNVAVPSDSYVPLQVTEATSGRPVTVYNQAPALRGKFDVLWDNSPALDTNYNGVDFSVNKRLSDGWMVMGGANFGRTRGDIYCNGTANCSNAVGDLNNPNIGFRQGLVGNDVPVSLRLSGSYQFPWGVSASATAQHYTGFPENTTVLVGSNTIKLTQVSQSLVVDPRGTTRAPSVNSLDVSLRKAWKGRGITLEPVLDAYNLMNTASLLSRVTQLGPTYQRPGTIQRGRLIRLGFNVSF
jgi:Carboxypeptidase regulatory-like domain